MVIIFRGSRQDQDASPIINESPKEEGEEAMLKHTTLESVAMQIMECQHILDVIRPHVVSWLRFGNASDAFQLAPKSVEFREETQMIWNGLFL